MTKAEGNQVQGEKGRDQAYILITCFPDKKQ